MNSAISHAGSRIERFFGLSARMRRNRQVTATAAGAPLQSHRFEKGEILALAQPIGSEIACLKGSVWITHDGDPKDVVLEAGERHVVDRGTPMLVQGLADATVSVLRRG